MKTSFHNEFIVNSQQLLLLGLFIGAACLLFIIFSRKKRRRPFQLSMKDTPSEVIETPIITTDILESVLPESAPEPPSILTQPIEPVQAPTAEPALDPSPAPIPITPTAPVKSPRVYFAFNGHDWEAHEALGVPLNAKLTTVTKMYQHLIKSSDSSTFDFYESAYTAIIKRRKET